MNVLCVLEGIICQNPHGSFPPVLADSRDMKTEEEVDCLKVLTDDATSDETVSSASHIYPLLHLRPSILKVIHMTCGGSFNFSAMRKSFVSSGSPVFSGFPETSCSIACVLLGDHPIP